MSGADDTKQGATPPDGGAAPYGRATRIAHFSGTVPDGFRAYPIPVTRASTTLFPTVAALREAERAHDPNWSYGLHGTPIQYELAARIAAIEGGRHGLLLPSGLAAISLVMFTLLRAGDEVLVPDNVYGPARAHADWMARDLGVAVRYYDPLVGAGIADAISPATRLIWIEAPGSVTMEVPDIVAITAAARARGVLTAIDHTWSAGMLCQPYALGVDIGVQALTKYQSGGSDLLMGSVVVDDDRLHDRLRQTRRRMGWGVSSDDCYFVLRSLASLKLRVDAHGATALRLAHWFAGRAEIARVLHPALPCCPGHASWQRDFSGASGLFSVVFDRRIGADRIEAFVDGLHLFGIGYSWGGAHSLAMPYTVPGLRTATHWPPPDCPEGGGLVRLYCGLEDADDLIADCAQSLARHLA